MSNQMKEDFSEILEKPVYTQQMYKIGFTFFIAIIAIISGTTTFSFFQMFFPSIVPSRVMGEVAASNLSGAFGAILFDVGAIFWMLAFLRLAETDEQRITSAVMVGVCFLGSAISSVAFLVLTSNGSMAISEVNQFRVGIFALIVVIIGVVSNFGAGMTFNFFTRESKQRVREADRRSKLQAKIAQQQNRLDAMVSEQVDANLENEVKKLAVGRSATIVSDFIKNEMSLRNASEKEDEDLKA